jgi:hypothetical protein
MLSETLFSPQLTDVLVILGVRRAELMCARSCCRFRPSEGTSHPDACSKQSEILP